MNIKKELMFKLTSTVEIKSLLNSNTLTSKTKSMNRKQRQRSKVWYILTINLRASFDYEKDKIFVVTILNTIAALIFLNRYGKLRKLLGCPETKIPTARK